MRLIQRPPVTQYTPKPTAKNGIIRLYFIAALTYLLTVSTYTVSFGQIVLPIKEHRGIVYVEGLTLNGKAANFVLDTGSSINLLDTCKENDYSFAVANENGSLVGTGGMAKRYAVREYTLTANGESIGVHFHAMDMNEIFRQHKGLNFAGLLGVPFFKFNKVVIDYQNMTLTINKPR